MGRWLASKAVWHASGGARWVQPKLGLLPQTAINSYYVGRDGNDWWPGHFRVHVPGNQRVKLVKLRLISWLFAPLLMC